MIIGAIAVAMWGRPRATADLDFTVRADPEGLEAIGAEAEREGFAVDRQWSEWNPLLRGVQIRLAGGGVIVDVARPRDEHDETALDRRRGLEISGRTMWFVSPEDLVIMKLKAGRPRDFEDAVTVLVKQEGSLDEPYMGEWAWRLGISGELAWIQRGGPDG